MKTFCNWTAALLLLVACTANTDAAAPPEVPQLRRPSDELRFQYCAEVEQTARIRASSARRRDNTLFGLAWTLGTTGVATGIAAHVTHDEDTQHTLAVVAWTTGAVGLTSLALGLLAHRKDPPEEYDRIAATASKQAIAIADLSDTDAAGAANNADESAKMAETALEECTKLEGAR